MQRSEALESALAAVGGGLEKKVVGDSPLLMSEELVKGITQ